MQIDTIAFAENQTQSKMVQNKRTIDLRDFAMASGRSMNVSLIDPGARGAPIIYKPFSPRLR